MGVHLRKLEEKDAPFMLEWMHDFDSVKYLKNNFINKTIDDCMVFISDSRNNRTHLHLAIVDDEDIYLGTVSLKYIDLENSQAEFAIVMRSSAMGTGTARMAMREMINIGFEKLQLKTIYWYVSRNNARAIRFYDKAGYLRTRALCNVSPESKDLYIWYMIQGE